MGDALHLQKLTSRMAFSVYNLQDVHMHVTYRLWTPELAGSKLYVISLLRGTCCSSAGLRTLQHICKALHAFGDILFWRHHKREPDVRTREGRPRSTAVRYAPYRKYNNKVYMEHYSTKTSIFSIIMTYSAQGCARLCASSHTTETP